MKKEISKKNKQILLIAIFVPVFWLIPSVLMSGFNSIREILTYGFPVVYNVFSKVKIKESGFFKYIEKKYPGSIFRLEADEDNKIAIHVYKKAGFDVLPYVEMKKF